MTLCADPRFEGGGGSSKLNYDIFRKAYGFLESYQDTEIEDLKKSLKKEKNQVIFATIIAPNVLFERPFLLSIVRATQ